MSVRISVIAGVAITSSNAFVTISSANAFASMFSFVRALALFSGGASPMAVEAPQPCKRKNGVRECVSNA